MFALPRKGAKKRDPTRNLKFLNHNRPAAAFCTAEPVTRGHVHSGCTRSHATRAEDRTLLKLSMLAARTRPCDLLPEITSLVREPNSTGKRFVHLVEAQDALFNSLQKSDSDREGGLGLEPDSQ